MQIDSGFNFVLFGGTGDLSMRKILPALYEAHRAGMLSDNGRIVAVARHAADRDGYIEWINSNVKSHVSKAGVDDAVWRSFLERIAYVKLDEGVTMLTNIVDCDLDTLRIGQRVKVCFKPAEGDAAIPMFTPA